MDFAKAKMPEDQSDADKKEAARILKRWETLDTAAVNWKTHWHDCYQNIVPRKEDVVSTRMPGDERETDLYDTTAILANEMLASALHGMLTNPETRFFEITFGDPILDQDESVKQWTQDVGDRMFRVLNNTNFQTEIYEIYNDLGAIGTACLYMGEHDKNVVHFSARAMKEVRVDENSLGLIDVVYRQFKWRAEQIIEEFGEDKCPYAVLKLASENSQEQLELIHAVEPLGVMNEKSHKVKSTYVLKNGSFILSKGSFREFPYAVPRWSKTTGEVYGRGPGMAMLADIRMVNAMMLTVIQGAQLTVAPPIMVEDDGVIGPVRITPAGITIIRAGSEMPRPLVTGARIDFGQKVVEDVRERIRAGFYVDQLQLQNGPQMTAEEVKQRTEEKLRLMGPVLGRQHFELLRPLITRVFDIMLKRPGMIPPAPEIIQGKDFDVRYSSLIARAQRVNEANNISRAFQLLAPLAQMKPDVLDVINEDKVAKFVWDTFGNRHELLLSKRELDAKRKGKQEAMAAMVQKQNEAHEAETANKVAPLVGAIQKQGMKQGVAQ